MPLTSDTVLYDLQAKTVLSGGILYRDILEPNLPGIVWAHLIIRSLVGWSSEAIRMADLFIVGSAILLLASLTRVQQSDRKYLKPELSFGPELAFGPELSFGIFGLVAMVFYLSRNEWCHCQRDSWMLLPVAGALWMRVRQIRGHGMTNKNDGPAYRLHWFFPLAEGMLWGTAFWIKPHIAVSVAAIALFDVTTFWHRRSQLPHVVLLITGGILAGIPGIVWMVKSGVWPHFWDMQINWNPEYLAAGGERRSLHRVWLMIIRFHPWWIIHVVALPLAIRQLWVSFVAHSHWALAWRTTRGEPVETLSVAFSPPENSRVISLLAVLYMSWLGQSLILQHAMDYIQVPPVILGLAFLASRPWQIPFPVRQAAVGSFLLFTLLVSPQLQPSKLQQWRSCLMQGTSRQTMAQLACGKFPDWVHLEAAENYLKQQDLFPGDLTCYNVHCIHAYAANEQLPSTRFVGISSLLQLFPSRAEQIREAVQNCGHRFILADVSEAPAMADQFPWNLPVTFQAGPFRVYQTETNADPDQPITLSIRQSKPAITAATHPALNSTIPKPR